mmetsp:Transcript_39863/g.124626  ORF Transcript_39863/g.124626 Transcript_39863/m.124626 type:complete len:220 (+) Transcript_39863:1976-2635(+)
MKEAVVLERAHAAHLEARGARRAEALLGVLLQQALDERVAVHVHPGRQLQLSVDDLLVDLLVVAPAEGRRARHHLIGERAQAPPVHGLAVALALEHLRRHVLRRAADRARAVLVVGVLIRRRAELLGEAEIRQADVGRAVEQEVLRLEVAVQDVHGVQELERERDLGHVELGRLGEQQPLLAQVEEELAALQVVHDEEELGVRLEGHLQPNHEGVRHLG